MLPQPVPSAHAHYRCVDMMLAEVAAGQGAEVIVATHNQVHDRACHACSYA